MINEVHYEITDKCNAACPQCVRTNPATSKPWDFISKNECTLDDFKRYSPPAFLANLKFIYFCGNYGDPVIANDLIPILNYCYESHPNLSIKVHSNCGLRTTEWWNELAQLTKDKKFQLVASIDGITQETQGMYRVGTNLEKIFNNLVTFIDAGGKAEWRFIKFKHNEHEVEKAKKISEEMNFVNFRSYSSNRFYDKPQFDYTYKGTEFTLYPSSEEEKKFTDRKLIAFTELEKEKSVAIDCIARRDNSIFIDYEGNILPCCHYGIRLYTLKRSVRDVNNDALVGKLLTEFGIERFNVNTDGFDAALQSCDEFLTFLESYWVDSKPFVCKMICGKKL